jgi:hypothetical protein
MRAKSRDRSSQLCNVGTHSGTGNWIWGALKKHRAERIWPDLGGSLLQALPYGKQLRTLIGREAMHDTSGKVVCWTRSRHSLAGTEPDRDLG